MATSTAHRAVSEPISATSSPGPGHEVAPAWKGAWTTTRWSTGSAPNRVSWSQAIQWLVAGRPARTPAAPSRRDPVQTEVVQREVAYAITCLSFDLLVAGSRNPIPRRAADLPASAARVDRSQPDTHPRQVIRTFLAVPALGLGSYASRRLAGIAKGMEATSGASSRPARER